MVQYLITFVVGFVGSVLSGLVGGGGSLITAPYLIFIGVSPEIAIATTKFCSLGLASGALRKFIPSGHVDWQHVPFKVVLSAVAAFLGSFLLLELLPNFLPIFIGIMMIGSSLLLIIRQKDGLVRQHVSQLREGTGDVLYFLALVLQAAFGAGVGILRVFILVFFFGLTTLEAQATARMSGIVMIIVSLLTYMVYGAVDYKHGIALMVGGLGGGYIGTHFALKHGDRFVRALAAGFVTVLGALLIWHSL